MRCGIFEALDCRLLELDPDLRRFQPSPTRPGVTQPIINSRGSLIPGMILAANPGMVTTMDVVATTPASHVLIGIPGRTGFFRCAPYEWDSDGMGFGPARLHSPLR
jgi:hypothetical protein